MTKRMFSASIVESDSFLDVPLTSQSLYFHLCMNADNDGFVNPKRIMRMIGAANDDLQVLIAKRFLICFESGVVVIKHWWINNTKRSDRHIPTTYQFELSSLYIKDNKSYTQNTTEMAIPTEKDRQASLFWQPDGNARFPQYKARHVQGNTMQSNTTQGKAASPPMFEFWQKCTGIEQDATNKKNLDSCSWLLQKYGEDNFKKLIEMAAAAHSDKYAGKAGKISDFYQLKNCATDLLVWAKSKTNSPNVEVIS